MGRIRILSEVVSNKIAAGEVVERPASVVKELVENALDAGSDRIRIEVEKGGRSLIRVSDNGCGMSRDDALMSLERYATSKIASDRDLFAIRTLGFRGEALPSIASVSRFTLLTREAEAAVGTRIQVDGGTLRDVRDTGAPAGTMISVLGLFFNTPARRKFLKTVNTEMGHIADTVSRMALARPGTRFTLVHNGRTVKDWPAADDGARRVADVLGGDVRPHLVPIAGRNPCASLSGWVCTSRVSRATSRGIFVFVNGRFVYDRSVQHALSEGFRGRLMRGQYPVAVLFISVPFDQVDVNVHPAKHQVRFARQRDIHELVAQAVAGALSRAERPRFVSPGAPSAPHMAAPRVADPEPAYGQRSREGGALETEKSPQPDGFSQPGHGGTPPDAPAPTAPPPDATGGQADLWPRGFFSELRIIGQFQDTYILCEAPGQLVLIDQHAAHERIYYEELRDSAGHRRPAAQMLALPEKVELDHTEAALLQPLLPELSRAGLDIEPFGGTTFVIRAVPQLLTGVDLAPVLREMAERMAAEGVVPEAGRLVDDCLKVMACHGAIRANQRLAPAQIGALLQRLDGCRDPAHCPHGRPTYISRPLREIEKAFGRLKKL